MFIKTSMRMPAKHACKRTKKDLQILITEKNGSYCMLHLMWVFLY